MFCAGFMLSPIFKLICVYLFERAILYITFYCFFSNTLYYLRPQKAPGFAYAWLELVSHRVFLGRVLAHSPAQKVWLLISFVCVYINNSCDKS